MDQVLNLYLVNLPVFIHRETGPHWCCFIVCCESDQEARKTHPDQLHHYSSKKQAWRFLKHDNYSVEYEKWVKPTDENINKLEVKQIGIACNTMKKGVLMAVHS